MIYLKKFLSDIFCKAKAQCLLYFTNTRLKPGVINHNYLKDFSPNTLIGQQ